MCLGRWLSCVSWKSVWVHLLTSWIDSIHYESIHPSLWLKVNQFTSTWIDSWMNRLFSVWNVSQNSLTCTESIHKRLESYQSSFWVHLNRLKYVLNRFILHAFLVCFLLSESTQPFSESIQFVYFLRKLSLFTPYYIYTSLHNFKIIESFATILFRSKKLIVHTFFKIKHFFLESLCSLSL